MAFLVYDEATIKIGTQGIRESFLSSISKEFRCQKQRKTRQAGTNLKSSSRTTGKNTNISNKSGGKDRIKAIRAQNVTAYCVIERGGSEKQARSNWRRLILIFHLARDGGAPCGRHLGA